MPRPARIEYEGAFHHVMNRGRNGQTIFHDDSYFEAFLKTLKEVSEQFDAIIHAYCLMSNHYHLLIETPKANLSRIMQHINGIYTQRHNRKRKRDGTLFRGRYKSVLVDEDSYLLQLSRYIHRNPLEVKRAMVSQLEDYPWSSYPSYINKIKAPDWLCRDKIYQMLGHKHRYKGYLGYVEKGVDEDIKRFYSKGNILGVLGDKEFRAARKEAYKNTDLLALRAALQDRPSIEEMIDIVSRLTLEKKDKLIMRTRGRQGKAPNRAFAIYTCHHYSGATHKEIAKYFGLKHVGSVCYPIAKVKKEIAEGHWEKMIKDIETRIFIIQYT